ncbi:MAG: hypothetical protein IJB86_04095 [Clostridia bacterium]|nr:hypothetical protein [Clostridia bacterium]
MKKVKSVLAFLFALILIITTLSTTVLAGNLNNCKWKTNYQYVTSTGTAYGTNTFYIYGNLTKNKVQIKNSTAGATLKVKDLADDVYDVAKFSVKIYKGSKLLNSYTVKLNGTFYVPAGLGTKYTVKIKFIPPTKMSYDYKLACKANSWYFVYKLLDI